ncbi:hypothetical protein AAG570_004658 [Ranatra chinensis]|uniref:Glucose-methanol-choline oxidoreductase N-terminal domain-containing protein n=1 Tax=Ranatra chinensis TaxID=642074 RepID=A0ABD0Y1H3_9HEMI
MRAHMGRWPIEYSHRENSDSCVPGLASRRPQVSGCGGTPPLSLNMKEAKSPGSVVASRLSEVEGWKVLLLESGTDDTLTTRVPLLFPNLMEAAGLEEQLPPLSPRIVFHKTEPQKRACRGNNGKCVLPRAYVLGGCSAINAMVYTRGNRADYDAWARMGNEGWSYQDVLPYFLKSEDQRDPRLYNDTR